MPTVSVIIPAYNAEKTILETIWSVQKQSFSDFEIIVVNDGSTDNTLNILNLINEKRLKVLSYPNGGVSIARNCGIAHSQGQFIALLDADDLWTSDKLALQLQALQSNSKAGVAYSWTKFMDENCGSFHDDQPLFFEGNVYSQLLIRNFIASGSNPLIRREALESVGGFDPALNYGEDWDLYLRLAKKWAFTVVPKPQVYYRQTSGSACSKLKELEKGIVSTIEKAFSSAPPDLQPLKKKSLANLNQFLAKLYLSDHINAQEFGQARKYLKKAIQLDPTMFFTANLQRLFLKFFLFQLMSPKFVRMSLKQINYFRGRNIIS